MSRTIYYHPGPLDAGDRLLDETWSAVPPCEIVIWIVHETGIRVISVVPVSVIRLSLAFHLVSGITIDVIRDIVDR